MNDWWYKAETRMDTDWYKDMQEFHNDVMLDDFETRPHIPSEKYKHLRYALIEEEVNETLRAIRNDDLVELADGIVDSIVVLIGTALTYGIDIRPVWDIIHSTNMAKKEGPMRSDGKRLKPKNWKPPDIKNELIRQGWKS